MCPYTSMATDALAFHPNWQRAVCTGFWTGDEEPGRAWSRELIWGGGDEVTRGMVGEYGGIKDRPSIYNRAIPPMAPGTIPSRASPRDPRARYRCRTLDGFRREDLGWVRTWSLVEGSKSHRCWTSDGGWGSWLVAETRVDCVQLP